MLVARLRYDTILKWSSTKQDGARKMYVGLCGSRPGNKDNWQSSYLAKTRHRKLANSDNPHEIGRF